MKYKLSKLLVLVVLSVVAALPVMGQGSFNSDIGKAQPKAPKFLLVTLATGTAVQASSTSLQFTTAVCYGLKTLSATAAPTANTASAFIGWVDSSGASGVTPGLPAFTDTIAAGAQVKLEQSGAKFDLNNLYLLGTTGDKVLIVYTQ